MIKKLLLIALLLSGCSFAATAESKQSKKEVQIADHQDSSHASVQWCYHYQQLDEEQAMTPENQWLREHCTEYGFILRYPADKEAITGITYESWHFRYVGVQHAKAMTEADQTLEEYLGETD